MKELFTVSRAQSTKGVSHQSPGAVLPPPPPPPPARSGQGSPSWAPGLDLERGRAGKEGQLWGPVWMADCCLDGWLLCLALRRVLLASATHALKRTHWKSNTLLLHMPFTGRLWPLTNEGGETCWFMFLWVGCYEETLMILETRMTTTTYEVMRKIYIWDRSLRDDLSVTGPRL